MKQNKIIITLVSILILAIAYAGGFLTSQLLQKPEVEKQEQQEQKEVEEQKENISGYYPEPIRGRSNIDEINNVYQQGVTFVIDLDTKGHDEIARLIDSIRDNVTNKEFDRSYNEQFIWNRGDGVTYNEWLKMSDEERITNMTLGDNIIYYRIGDAVLARVTEYNSAGLQKQSFDNLYNYFVKQGFIEDGSKIGIGGTHSNTAFLKGNLVCRLMVGPEINNKSILETEILCGYYDEPLQGK